MGIPKTFFRFLWHFACKQWVKFSLMFFASVVWAANDAFFPFFIKKIVDTLQHYQGDPAQVYSALKWILLGLIGFWAVTEFVNRSQGVIAIYAMPKFRADIRESVLKYVKSHSHEYFSSNFAGNIAKKLADLPNSCQNIMEIVCYNIVTSVVGAVIVLIFMWHVKPIFAVVLFLWLCLHLGISFVFLKQGNVLWEIHSDSVSTLSGKIVDVLTNMANVRLFARSRYEMDYLNTYQHDELKKAKKAMWQLEIMRMGLGVSGLSLVFSMIFLLVYGWIHHWVTLGDFTQVGMQSFWLLGWIWFLSFQISMFAREQGTINNALHLVSQGHDLTDQPNARTLKISHGEIRFEHVSFAYQKKRIVFDDMNVVIPAGQKVGLVGFSGSGKSTFVNLILRFYDVQSGKILIDGQNIAEVTQDSLRAHIGMIPQDPSLFHRSLRENIQYGRLDATYEEILRAAKLSHCDEFIERLDEKYDALVGERGVKLSGGQRQRIAIARAMLKNAPILILDEATSSLDSVTEKLIQESLHQLMQGRTTIVVAHRLSTLADMDRILVFHKGKIIEDGRQEDLLKTNGHFAMLWNMQTEGFLPESE